MSQALYGYENFYVLVSNSAHLTNFNRKLHHLNFLGIIRNNFLSIFGFG